MIRLLYLCCLTWLIAGPAAAQMVPPQARPASTPSANPEDIASVEAIVAALYDVISGDQGQQRDWDRFRSLFAPDAYLAVINPDAPAGLVRMTPEGYIDRSGERLVRIGFTEKEIAARRDRFGHIAHVFTTYEGYTAESGDAPAVRGINSVQLYNDGTRWWILAVLWQAETEELKLPSSYLE